MSFARMPGGLKVAASVLATHGVLSSQAQAPDAAALIARAREAYLRAPFAERLQIEVVDATGRRENSEIIVRVEPGDQGVRSMLVELPTMRIWSGDERLVVVGPREAGAWWELTDAGVDSFSRMEGALPHVIAPALAIVAGRERWTPVTPAIDWTGASEDPGGTGWLIGGVSGEFAVQATFDRGTSRLARVAVSGPSGGQIVNLSVVIEQVAPGSPSSWRPQTEGLERRESLAAVIDRKPTLLVGDSFPAVGWVLGDGKSWQLADAFAPAAGVNAPAAAVVVLFRVRGATSARSETLRDVRVGVEGLRATLRDRLRERVVAGERGRDSEVLLVPAAVFGGEGFDAGVFDQISGEIGDLAPDAPGLVWTMPERRTIDAVAPGAMSVMCVVDRGGAVRHVIRMDGSSDRQESVRKEIAAAISETLGEL